MSIAGPGRVVVEPAVAASTRGPGLPATGLLKNTGAFLPAQGILVGAVLPRAVEMFQKQPPRGRCSVLSGTGGASGFFPLHVVNILEGLFTNGFHSV